MNKLALAILTSVAIFGSAQAVANWERYAPEHPKIKMINKQTKCFYKIKYYAVGSRRVLTGGYARGVYQCTARKSGRPYWKLAS